MSTAIQDFKDKMSFSVTPTTFEAFHLSLKKHRKSKSFFTSPGWHVICRSFSEGPRKQLHHSGPCASAQ